MPTEQFNAAKERFEAITYKITNGTEKTEESPDMFITLITKLLKFWSEMMLRFFGGKGFSDILLFR